MQCGFATVTKYSLSAKCLSPIDYNDHSAYDSHTNTFEVLAHSKLDFEGCSQFTLAQNTVKGSAETCGCYGDTAFNNERVSLERHTEKRTQIKPPLLASCVPAAAAATTANNKRVMLMDVYAPHRIHSKLAFAVTFPDCACAEYMKALAYEWRCGLGMCSVPRHPAPVPKCVCLLMCIRWRGRLVTYIYLLHHVHVEYIVYCIAYRQSAECTCEACAKLFQTFAQTYPLVYIRTQNIRCTYTFFPTLFFSPKIHCRSGCVFAI